MSSPTLHASPDEAHAPGSHRLGSVLAIILTIVPFWLVMARPIADPGWTAGLVFAFALVQIVVHVVSFLHVDASQEGGWTLLAFLFTAVIVVVTIGGSIWVMTHLNTNMMPSPDGVMQPVR